MAWECCYLTGVPFAEVHRTFVEAFSDYAIGTGEVAESALFNRAVKNGIDLDSSVGAFDSGRMVGFTMVGLDRWEGEAAAFDIGTGIIKAYRGRGIARGMFDHAVPRLKAKGVKRFILEVLKQNDPAFKAYSRTGFRITREFDCFELKLDEAVLPEDPGPSVEIELAGKERLGLYAEHLDWQPSWENSFASIARIPDEVLLLEASLDGAAAGLLVHYPALKWILSLVVARPLRRKGIGSALLWNLTQRLREREPALKLVNVLSTDSGMLAFLRRAGFKDYVGQYEMELLLE